MQNAQKKGGKKKMASIRDIYKKERITAAEVSNIVMPEMRRAIILDWEEKSRTYKEEQYGYIELVVEFNKERRKLNLSYDNANDISKMLGEDPEKWKNAILMLNTNTENGIDKLKVIVYGRA